MKKGTALAILLAMLALPLAAPLAAEEHEDAAPPAPPIIWVSFLKSVPGGGQSLVQSIIQEDGALFGDLLAQGKIYEWGVAQPINHRGDDPYNVAQWATFANWAAVDAFVAGFLAKRAAKSPEERAANQQAYLSSVVAGSHGDAILQGVHAATDGKRPAYLVIGYHKAHTGKEQALTAMWQEHARPLYEKLLADGAIQGFGLFTQAIHGDHRYTHGGWSTMSGLGGVAAVNKALSTLPADVMTSFMETVDWEAHWDDILAVVHYQNAQSQ